MRKLRIAVIGAGHLGTYHTKMYHLLKRSAGIDLVGVADINEQKAKDLAKKYKTAYYANPKALIGKVDAVSIAVPTSLHYSVAKDFLEAGVHVLIEKPITKTLFEADELIRLANAKNLIIQVGHIERFNPAVLAMEPFLDKPKFIESQRLGSIKNKSRIKDVGVVLDLMIHDIDIILALVNSKVKSIVAFGQSTVSEHEDVANVRLTFEDNTIADITASRVTKEEVRKLRIFQERSYILLDYMDHEVYIYKKQRSNRFKKNKLRLRKTNALMVELKSFIDCIKRKTKPLVSGKEGREALSVALDILDKIHSRAK
ncbi:MAG: Gfo/Idh/MocA family oxidoreductase [Candidatus Omnitrophica bacterium]|nr:Gfo/Idh/MocA family oxidoreductase [Candidatus Omnitrophota bacterium]